jgi:hypothetical protein
VAPTFQLGSQFDVVINLAIKNYPQCAIFGLHRLVPKIAKFNNCKSAMTQSNRGALFFGRCEPLTDARAI